MALRPAPRPTTSRPCARRRAPPAVRPAGPSPARRMRRCRSAAPAPGPERRRGRDRRDGADVPGRGRPHADPGHDEGNAEREQEHGHGVAGPPRAARGSPAVLGQRRARAAARPPAVISMRPPSTSAPTTGALPLPSAARPPLPALTPCGICACTGSRDWVTNCSVLPLAEPIAYTTVACPAFSVRSAGPITGLVVPATATAADTGPEARSAVRWPGFVSPVKTGSPPARTSTAGAAAVWRTTSRAFPFASPPTGLVNAVSTGVPAADRWATSDTFAPAGRVTFLSMAGAAVAASPALRTATSYDPGARDSGPATWPGLKLVSAALPLT